MRIPSSILVLVAAIALIAMIVFTNMLGADLASAASGNRPAAERKSDRKKCAEDSTCFVWSTMGNLERGVTLIKGSDPIGRKLSGRRVSVTACEFAYADYTGQIDWSKTPKLRGDHFARAHGCNPFLFS